MRGVFIAEHGVSGGRQRTASALTGTHDRGKGATSSDKVATHASWGLSPAPNDAIPSQRGVPVTYSGILMLNRPVKGLVARAQTALGMTHEQFGTALGSSKRTAARWAAGMSRPSVPQVRKLACLVYPGDAELAAELASAASTTLVGLGLVQPPAPVVLAASLPRGLVIDAVVLAAADAAVAAPRTVRVTLLAAFRRARELGLTVEDVETALAATQP
jgi:transcriptional regulator with XRE-family HTH domain